jgi:HK97 family phage major capsid protein/HK97 family phage prohead protease
MADKPAEIKLGHLLRDLTEQIVVRKVENQRTALSFPASSAEPYERYFGTEVLDHSARAVRMDRFARGAVPLLFNHNMDDPIGMVTAGRLEGGRLMVDAELFATERAAEVERMVDGGLRNVSIGYRVHEFTVAEKSETYTATDWEPLEVSIVTVPADATVGIGRSAEGETPVKITRGGAADVQPAAPAASSERAKMPEVQAAAGASADVQVIDNGATERLRIKSLTTLAKQHSIDEGTLNGWIDNEGFTVDDGARAVLAVIAERNKRNPQRAAADLDLSPKDVKRFSLARAIMAVGDKSWAKAGFEAECSQAIAQRLGKPVDNERSIYVPLDVQTFKRDLAVGTGTAGGNMVQTDVTSFIEQLRNRSVVMSMGATMLSGLRDSIAIPRQTSPGTAFWLANEQTAITESQQVIGQLTMSPKNVGAYTEYSRQLLQQSTIDVESFINADLAAVVGLAVDSAALSGPGTAGQPTGITATSGIGAANPTTGTNVVYSDLIRFQTAVAATNALFPSAGYVTTPTVAGILMGKSRFANTDTPLWDGGLLDGTVAGLRGFASLQLGSGQCLFGDFSKLIIGEWGVLQLEVNPYANFQAGIYGVRAMYTVDVGVRYPAAFALGTGLTG